MLTGIRLSGKVIRRGARTNGTSSFNTIISVPYPTFNILTKCSRATGAMRLEVGTTVLVQWYNRA